MLSQRARIIAKRAETQGYQHVSTLYYITFKLLSGERREFPVRGEEYGMWKAMPGR